MGGWPQTATFACCTSPRRRYNQKEQSSVLGSSLFVLALSQDGRGCWEVQLPISGPLRHAQTQKMFRQYYC